MCNTCTEMARKRTKPVVFQRWCLLEFLLDLVILLYPNITTWISTWYLQVEVILAQFSNGEIVFSPGKSQAAHPQPIVVAEGDNVTIRCQSHPTINLEEYTLDVKRVDGNSSDLTRVVYSRRHGKDHLIPQMEQYRNRVFLINDDLRMGVMSLVILSVQRSDGGHYKSYIPRLKSASIFNIVGKYPVCSTFDVTLILEL